MASWQLAGWLLGTTAAETGLHTGVWVFPAEWVPNQGYTQAFEYAQVFGSAIGSTDRRFGSPIGLGIPNRGYTEV